MRRFLIVSLLLAPMLLAAPALASPPDSDVDASSQILRPSPGVTAPHLVTRALFDAQLADSPTAPRANSLPSYPMDGSTTSPDIEVMSQPIPIHDETAIHAASRFSILPSALENGPLPVDMTWVVAIDR